MRKVLFIFLLLSNYCFAGNILTTKGYVPESDIKAGDRVVSYDIRTGETIINTVMEARSLGGSWFKAQHQPYSFYYFNGELKFCRWQSIYDGNRIVHAWEVEIGDTIFSSNGNPIIVKSIGVSSSFKTKWYRFIISGNHSYINDGVLVHNASRFWVGGGASANWNATSNTNWSATSGGANNATVPGASDDVTFDGAGGSGNTSSTVSATITVLSLTFTGGYTQTVTLNATTTIAGSFTDNTAHSWAGASQINISATGTITSGGKTFPNSIGFTGGTHTLSGNWTISGTLIIATGASQVVNHTTTETLTAAGLTMSVTTASGNAEIILSGGTWSGAGILTGNNLTFAGNVTVSGSVFITGGTIKYTSGTITTTSSTLTVTGSTTFNTNGMSWNNITATTSTQTWTINSLLTCTGTLSVGVATTTFGGSAGWTTATFTGTNTAAITITFAHSVTYTITTAFTCNTSRVGSIYNFTSDDGTIKAIITLNQGATCNVLASFTRIDASAGRSIVTFNGTVTTCLNVVEKHDYGTIGYAQ